MTPCQPLPANRTVTSDGTGSRWPLPNCPIRPLVLLLAALASLAAQACGDRGRAPAPTFESIGDLVEDSLMTVSSPALMDLDGDGVRDIVFGTGYDRVQPVGGEYVLTNEPAVPGYVLAISGADNRVLWRAPHPGEAYTTARFIDIDHDGVPDVIMGGREAAFAAYSGSSGDRLWRLDPTSIAPTENPYNFATPAVIGDVDGDGTRDLVVIYGGDATKRPGEPRNPGYIAIVSSAAGTVLHRYPMPDGRESYSSPVAYERADGTWIVFGTGGEVDGGAAYRVPLDALLSGDFAERVERLISPGEKGVIAPATLVDINGDGELDIVVSAFDGRLVVVDGSTGSVLWERGDAGEETYHPAAVVRIGGGRLGLFVSRGIGVFPAYVGTVHRLLNAADGGLLFQSRDAYNPAGAPLAVDLTGDGVDEVLYFSMLYPTGEGARIGIVYSGSREPIVHDLATNLTGTPVVADPRGSGSLELIGVPWLTLESADGPDWKDLRWRLLRLDLSAPPPPFIAWGGYMGTDHDGMYRAAPAHGPD